MLQTVQLALMLVHSDQRTPASWLCDTVHAVSGPFCHVALHVRTPTLSQMQLPAGDYILENAMHTDVADVITGQKNRNGAQLLPFDERAATWVNVTERPLGHFTTQVFERVFWSTRHITFSPSPLFLWKLMHRAYDHWPQQNVCSTFVAHVLAQLQCIDESARATFNALPSDFDTSIGVQCARD